MLWYKAWRESRSRFLLFAAAVTLYSVSVLVNARTAFPPPEVPQLPYSAFVWGEFYAPWRAVAFVVVALVLGLGGLQRERAAGTSPFTLALPVGRGRLVGTRFFVGLFELLALAIIPIVVVPFLSPVLVHQSYPALQSVRYAALFASWGVVWFAIAFLWSVTFRGEFTAAAVAILSPFAYMIVYANVSRGGRRFFAANPAAMMSGGLDQHLGGRMLLVDPLPWSAMLALAVVAVALLFGAWRITVRQSF
jgi:ABC-type transport system involved in multi-copper enzyme maturation permease subunit